jgi:hypothetical protein
MSGIVVVELQGRYVVAMSGVVVYGHIIEESSLNVVELQGDDVIVNVTMKEMKMRMFDSHDVL